MAEDEEAQAPARPGSRGPRVVTGDMKRSAVPARVVTGPGVARPPASDDEVTAETRVVPGQAAPPQPTTPSRRPPGATARGPAAVPAAPAESAPEPEPEPEPWKPITVTRNTPPSVHGSAASSAPAPSGKPPKPGKQPKPSKPGKPPKASRAAGSKSGATLAFVLAVISLVTAGILAIPALILAARANKRGGGGLVTATRVVAVLSLLAWLGIAGLVIADVARPEGVDYAKLKAGDCIDTPDGSEVRRLTVRACDRPHDAEVFAVVIHPAAPGDAFPGATTLLEYAANVCLGQPFADYVGIPRAQSQLTEFEIVPESEAWHEGRRGLVCAVDNAERAPLTASVKGTAK